MTKFSSYFGRWATIMLIAAACALFIFIVAAESADATPISRRLREVRLSSWHNTITFEVDEGRTLAVGDFSRQRRRKCVVDLDAQPAPYVECDGKRLPFSKQEAAVVLMRLEGLYQYVMDSLAQFDAGGPNITPPSQRPPADVAGGATEAGE